ncbi:hypothetical protein N8I77_002202 [Diaporthe amygdali]|uniref:Uncharacterized protein n=1 Tax=Phomopsis amygdali TaxID=1214568 RepID=A0AAD9ST87_PHOAM|nr:hypothetical protein N8I77_002202 [Diaporthe amygdali]
MACLDETLRLISTNSTGFPRYSPGAVVDGHYIPKGTSTFALGRSPRYFHDPMCFRPERYLPSSHPLYDDAFANDARKGMHAFSLGPQARLFISKVLWQFDVLKAPRETLNMEGSSGTCFTTGGNACNRSHSNALD